MYVVSLSVTVFRLVPVYLKYCVIVYVHYCMTMEVIE